MAGTPLSFSVRDYVSLPVQPDHSGFVMRDEDQETLGSGWARFTAKRGIYNPERDARYLPHTGRRDMRKKWYEIVMEGPFDLIKGFIIGFFEGRRIAGAIIFEREHHVKREERLEYLLRAIHVEEDRVHMIMGKRTFRILDQALNNRRHEIPMKIVSEREIIKAHFNFTYAAYAKRFGNELKALFNDLPAGIRLEGYQPEEIERQLKESTVGYAPLHKYEIRAKGRVSGPAHEVIDFYDRIEHNDWIEPEEIELEF